MKYRYAVVAYKDNKEGTLDVPYENVQRWYIRNGTIILLHEKCTTIIPLAAIESCDIRDE